MRQALDSNLLEITEGIPSLPGAMDAMFAARMAGFAALHSDPGAASDCGRYSGRAAPYTQSSSWHDFQRLLALAASERWTDDTPVDPDRLGPLWPFGKPKGWSAFAERGRPSQVLQIDLVVPSGMSAAVSREFNHKVAAFYAALSGLHAAMGGTGLRILDEGSCESIPAEDEAPLERGSPRAGVLT